MIQSEWENWLMNEISLCEDLSAVLYGEGSSRKGEAEVGSDAKTVLKSMGTSQREVLMEWQRKHCGSCRSDYEKVVADRGFTGL